MPSTANSPADSARARHGVRYYLGVLIWSAILLSITGFVLTSALRSSVTLGTSPQFASCLPWRWFIETQTPPHHIAVGELVIARTPKAFGGLRLGKLVAGVPGNHVVDNRQGLWINGQYWGRLWLRSWLHNQRHKHNPALPYSFVIPANHYLLLGTSPLSLDGRYWGLVRKDQIYGHILSPL